MDSTKGVSLSNVPNMKFILNGRTSPWSVGEHGFTFLDHRTALSLQTFHSSPGGSGHAQSLFEFSGSSAVHAGSSSADSKSWVSQYYREIAEACKRVLPQAEAVFVSYNVLRKSDLSFGDGKYRVAPKDPHSEVHKLASQMVKALNTIDFLAVAEQDELLGMLNDQGSGREGFVLRMVESSAPMNATMKEDFKAELLDLLLHDEVYNYVAQAKEALGAVVQRRRDLSVPPKDPQSRAHQVVSQILASLQYVDLYPKSYKATVGAQLHLEGDEGVEKYLQQTVLGHSSPKEFFPHALMPGASPELQAEVLALLRGDAEHYDFVARVRRLIPRPDPRASGEASDAVAFQPPALGGAHTDCNAEAFQQQFRAAIPESHALGAPAAGRRRRVVFLKFWRSVADAPIENHHLAVLDKSSLQDSEISGAEINYKGYPIKQNRMNRTVDADKLNWVYFPRMHRDEVICFQQGDLTMHGPGLNGGPSRITFPKLRQDHATFHGAFEDPTAPAGAAPRQSIEAGAFVFLPEQPDVLSKL